MSTLLSSSRHHWMVRSSQAASMALACALLSGCAIWPKALTFWGDSEPAPAPAMATQPAAAPSEPVDTTPIVMSAPVTEPGPTEATPVTDLPPEPKPMAPSKSAGPVKMEKGYYINVGLFAVPSNASNAFQKLDKAGLPAYTELLETNVGKLIRVRVGGFATKAKADAAAKQIRAMQLEAIVFRHK